MLKILALGALGYAGFRMFRSSQAAAQSGRSPDLRLAGGPLSNQAALAPAGSPAATL